MFFIGLILILISIILLFVVYNKAKSVHEINTKVDKKNEEIEKRNKELEKEKVNYLNEIEICQQNFLNIQEAIRDAGMSAEQFYKNIQQSYNNYEYSLEKDYQEKEEEYDILVKELYKSYDNEQDRILDQIKWEQSKLDNIRSTRAAAIQAQIKEREIKDQLSFYCLQPTENELDDIKALERVKPNLHQPRILCMLIWSTYFQKPMTALCNNVLGTAVVCGIYKITNQETGECYIGQAVDIAKRWKDHAKCGLDIDRPQGNKLYQNMIEYGLWNFTFELLEECPREQLNEKEKFYISLYDSCNYGFNSTIGNK